jgi:pimeloyl-ACP methyl ester carboxylesterase
MVFRALQFNRETALTWRPHLGVDSGGSVKVVSTFMRRRILCILSVLLASGLGIFALYARDLANARARLVGRSLTMATSFGTLEYAQIGKGEPILVVHGAAGGFDQALDMAGPLAEHGFRLIAPSRFGYLRSSLPTNLRTAMQADAYVELLNHLGIAKVDVVSISAGAWSAMQLAIRHPERVRALVLLVPADYLPPGTTIHGGALVRAMINSDFVAWAALKLMPVLPGSMTRMMLGTDPAVVRAANRDEKARVRQVLDHLLPVGPRVAGMNFDVATAAAREPYAIEKIGCPVLAISAEDDRFGTARRARLIASTVVQGRLVVFPTGGHALVGRMADTVREGVAFLHAGRE